MSAQPNHKQIFKLACQSIGKNNSKILRRSGYFSIVGRSERGKKEKLGTIGITARLLYVVIKS